MECSVGLKTESQQRSDELAIHSDAKDDASYRNFLVLTVYAVLVRTGWIFKTESIIMPAILDTIGGGGWLRGCLPMLNRLGQSIPPILAAANIRRVPRKKWVAVCCIAAMGFSFIALAVLWWMLDSKVPNWLPFAFLAVYGFFWFCVGIHNLSISLLYGKLVSVTSRGRLMLVTMTAGATSAITCAWFLLRKWLRDDGNFMWLFLFTGIMFVLASITAMLLKEQRDSDTDSHGAQIPDNRKVGNAIASALAILRTDSNFRLLAVIAACFGVSITLFPHYQAYAKQNLSLDLSALVPWVIAQNIGAAAFSIPLGRMADKFGNRMSLRFAMFALCLAPILTILMVYFPTRNPEVGFYVVFFLVGLTPVTMRVFNNYTLEIADGVQQPVYLSTLGAVMALPVVVMSTIVGALVDLVSFEAMFILVVMIIFIGWTLTFKLVEPRSVLPKGVLGGPQTTILD